MKADSAEVARVGRLVAVTVPVGALDAATRAGMWSLYASHYERVSEAVFATDLAAKDDVIVVRDVLDGSLQGFTTIAVRAHDTADRRFTIVFSGDTIIAPAYQGQSALQRAFVRYVVKAALRARGTEVYWFLISKGFKTYLLLSRNFLEYWPRHDRATPEPMRELIAGLARERFGSAFVDEPILGAPDPSYGKVRFDPPGARLKPGVAPVSPEALHAPDVRFFVQANPGHDEGDELCCIGRVDLAMGLNYVRRLGLRTVRRALGGR